MLVRRMVGSRLVVASLEGRLLVADCMQRAVWVACIVSYCMHDSEHWWIAVAKDSFDPPSSFLPSPRHELDVCRRFADVLRTFCGRFADALRMFCRRFADVLQTFCRCFADVLQTFTFGQTLISRCTIPTLQWSSRIGPLSYSMHWS